MSTQVAGTIGAHLPADIEERQRAIDPGASVLVQAPAGSGKTTLLTQRFLSLLALVEDPSKIVAITFTNAAAAEMRGRVLNLLSRAAEGDPGVDQLAVMALDNLRAHQKDPVNNPAILRICTIDAFCREIALQQPVDSGLGGGLTIADLPEILYREAARVVLDQLEDGPEDLRQALTDLLLWRDNSIPEIERQIVSMLATRDRWMQPFVLNRKLDEAFLRAWIERPFARAAIAAIEALSAVFSDKDWAEASDLARFASANLTDDRFATLAGCPDFPGGPFEIEDVEAIDGALRACQQLGDLLLTKDGKCRKTATKNEGFPADGPGKAAKQRLLELAQGVTGEPETAKALESISQMPSVHYTDDEWRIVRACFIVLHHATANLRTVFAQVGKVDFIEVAQIAQAAIDATDENGLGAFAVADDISHLLVDEFQDTSRRQHALLAGLISHWEDREYRTCFVVGDPLQSIYFFRDADAELFPRVRDYGLKLSQPGDSLPFESVQLSANFRTEPALVNHLNRFFADVFREEDGSGLKHTVSVPARSQAGSGDFFRTHLEFVPAPAPFKPRTAEYAAAAEKAHQVQITEIVELVKSYEPRIEAARKSGAKFRVAILGRAHKALAPIAHALREAGIRYRAIDLEPLNERQEVLDVIALARAILNREDRVAWLGVLRAPWCGLDLETLHTLTSGDEDDLLIRPVADVARERLGLIDPESRVAVLRVLDVLDDAMYLRASEPSMALGTWIETVWLRLGGASCVDFESRANLDLLWKVFDDLPYGEQDLLGPALEAALGKLYAQPDPQSSNDQGVLLLTIHKSKGLEFESVIVVDLQAQSSNGQVKMLSWMERGLAQADATGDLTEFLVAPFQAKGTKGGATKRWVDAAYREREHQELRRLLYVAATRAREELHLFARPEYRIDSGECVLVVPSDSLLATAWPALESEVRTAFEALKGSGGAGLAALPPVSEKSTATMLSHLPAGFSVEGTMFPGRSRSAVSSSGSNLVHPGFGGVISRLYGSAVHSLLEQVGKWRATLEWESIGEVLGEEKARLTGVLRSGGLTQVEASRLATEAIEAVHGVIGDPLSQWVLDSHREGDTEVRWSAVLEGEVRNIRPDRIFLAGPEPLTEAQASVTGTGTDTWWIVDYKTASVPGDDLEQALPGLRETYRRQLETYAKALRLLHGSSVKVNVGLYFPRWKRLDYWESPIPEAF